MTGARVLVVTSVSSPAAVVVPLLAALDAAGAEVRALDVGRLGTRSGGAAQRVMRAIAGELSGRRLEHELDARPPEVAVAFDPGSVAALAELRAGRPPMAIAAVVAELEPAADWGHAVADRYLALDDHAAAALDEHGVAGERVVTVGPLVPAGFAAAALEARGALRERFKIAGSNPVVVIEVAGLGYEAAAQLALQLSLTAPRATFLFAAGDDAEAAAALRARVPTLGMRAKLFGATADVPLYFRAADVVVARPRLASVMAALAVGARVVAFGDAGDEGRGVGAALEARGLGRRVESASLIGGALEALAAVGRPAELAPVDGAWVAADAILLMARDRELVVAETDAADEIDRGETRASRAGGAGAAAGDLEDLGGDDAREHASPPGAAPDPTRAVRRAELAARLAEANRQVASARAAAARFDQEAEVARAAGDTAAAAAAGRRADDERQAMHAALARLAEIAAAQEALGREPGPAGGAGAARPAGRGGGSARAPRPSSASVDDLLSDLKRRGEVNPRPGQRVKPAAGRAGADVDDELEALKRKMASKKKGTP